MKVDTYKKDHIRLIWVYFIIILVIASIFFSNFLLFFKVKDAGKAIIGNKGINYWELGKDDYKILGDYIRLENDGTFYKEIVVDTVRDGKLHLIVRTTENLDENKKLVGKIKTECPFWSDGKSTTNLNSFTYLDCTESLVSITIKDFIIVFIYFIAAFCIYYLFMYLSKGKVFTLCVLCICLAFFIYFALNSFGYNC